MRETPSLESVKEEETFSSLAVIEKKKISPVSFIILWRKLFSKGEAVPKRMS